MLREVAEVAADDGRGDPEHLVGLRVHLDEALEGLVVRGVADDGLPGAEGLLLLGRVAVQVAADQARVEDDADGLVHAADELEAGACVHGVARGVLHRDGEDGGAAAPEDVLVGLGREVLDHFLGEPELLEDGVRDLFFLEFELSHVQRSFADSASGCKIRKRETDW